MHYEGGGSRRKEVIVLLDLSLSDRTWPVRLTPGHCLLSEALTTWPCVPRKVTDTGIQDSEGLLPCGVGAEGET